MLIFNKYKIENKIAQGGMGIVYKAYDTFIGRTVAIKELNLDSVRNPEDKANLIERFKREAETASLLNSPNVVRIYDFGEFENKYYIVMEFLSGKDLKEYIINNHDFTTEQLIHIFIQICEGLGHAHEKGVVHRDIKPANIQIINDKKVKITDFGISKDTNAKSDLTQDGDMFGTIGYMPPEQLKNTKSVDHRADLFSLGALMYESLTNKLPFEADSIANTIFKILMENPEKITTLNPKINNKLENIVFKLLEKEPNSRYQKSEEIVKDLKECLLDNSEKIDLSSTLILNRNDFVTKLDIANENIHHLVKGEKIFLKSNHLCIGFNYNKTEKIEAEVCALMLNKDEKIQRDEDFVFFNNLSSHNNALKLDFSENRLFDSVLEVDLEKVEERINKIIIIISTLDDSTLEKVNPLKLKLIDYNDKNIPYSLFEPDKTTTEKTLVLAEIYKHNNSWKLNVSNYGFNKNLEEFLKDYIADNIKLEN